MPMKAYMDRYFGGLPALELGPPQPPPPPVTVSFSASSFGVPSVMRTKKPAPKRVQDDIKRYKTFDDVQKAKYIVELAHYWPALLSEVMQGMHKAETVRGKTKAASEARKIAKEKAKRKIEQKRVAGHKARERRQAKKEREVISVFVPEGPFQRHLRLMMADESLE